jgi:protein-disulfide isomerase
MKTLVLLTASTAALAACQPDTRNIDKKLDAIQAKLNDMDKRIGGAGGARPQRQQPDASKVYAVPIDKDPFVGPADAKVTLVEAYDYG